MTFRQQPRHLALTLISTLALWGQSKIDLRTQTKSVDFSGASATKPAKMGATLPATCGQGEFFFLSSAPAGQNVFGCASSNTWSQEGGAVPQGSLLPAQLNNMGKLLTTDGTNAVWQSIGGDVSGSPASLTISALRGKAFSTAAPSDGQLLKFNGTTSTWEPTALAGDIQGNPAAVTVKALQGRGLSVAAPADGQVLKFNGTTGFWEAIALGGDLTGVPASLLVSGLQGRVVSNALPSGGQLLGWSAANATWTPTTFQVPPNFGGTFNNVTTFTIPGTQHNLNTANLLVSCYDTASPANLIEPGQVTIDPASFNVTVRFATPQSGKCLVNGSGGVSMGATALTGSATLGFPGINAMSCASELTISVPGARLTDAIAPGWPSLPAGFLGMMRVSANDTVALRLCNFSGVNATPPSLTYSATVVRPF